MSEKEFRREQLQLLTKSHYDAVQPIIKRLAAIESEKLPRFLFDPSTGSILDQVNMASGPAQVPWGLVEAGEAPDKALVEKDEQKHYYVAGRSFADVWAEKAKEGYFYARDAREGVRMGWGLACEAFMREAAKGAYLPTLVTSGVAWVAPQKDTMLPNCICFPGTCREQVNKDGVTVSGNRCKAHVPAR